VINLLSVEDIAGGAQVVWEVTIECETMTNRCVSLNSSSADIEVLRGSGVSALPQSLTQD